MMLYFYLYYDIQLKGYYAVTIIIARLIMSFLSHLLVLTQTQENNINAHSESMCQIANLTE